MEKPGSYSSEQLPIDELLIEFAPPYTPEYFTPQELRYLRPFFSNTDGPVFVIQGLPEEVIGALSSRYSRTTHSLRRVFLDEYIGPIIEPDKQRGWERMSPAQKEEALATRIRFEQFIDFMNQGGGMENVVNIHRAREFFRVWLSEYGDDSIAELGGAHVCLEGLSGIAVEEIVSKRIGISPIVKSSRYVDFSGRRPDGHYQYVVPGEIRRTMKEVEYRKAMDVLFDTYTAIREPYLDYIKGCYPQGEQEPTAAFNRSRSAKRYDDIRDLLPFGTQTNMALFGNGRAFEDLINRLLAHPLGEVRWWGQSICHELQKVVPSFVQRPTNQRGAAVQLYRNNQEALRLQLAGQVFDLEKRSRSIQWVKLVSAPEEAETVILATHLLSVAEGVSLTDALEQIRSLTANQRAGYLATILYERLMDDAEPRREAVRFRKVPRAFENAYYLFELWARGGDFRDLHRHRINTQESQLFTTGWGYDLEPEVLESPFADQVHFALRQAEEVYGQLRQISPYIAQYAVPFAFLQHWYLSLTAREIYWMVELRTGPQGRPHYRQILQQLARLAIDSNPAVFQGMMTDWGDYSLARRESEMRREQRLP